MPWIKVNPVVDHSVIALCVRPYYNHPKGCPNWNSKEGCPPKCPSINDTIDLTKDVYAIYNVFDLASHVNRMKQRHPDWSDRQLYCCLYWQPKARKQLREEIVKFVKKFSGFKIIGTPEGQGVNLTKTMNDVGIKLDWPPRKKAYQIVLAGSAR